mgnify:CR=1 FL=1
MGEGLGWGRAGMLGLRLWDGGRAGVLGVLWGWGVRAKAQATFLCGCGGWAGVPGGAVVGWCSS